jgi:aminoglycoside/choline kinase family phosphotransferase
MSSREEELKRWLAEQCGLADFELEPASSDASFRRYFRVRLADGSTRIAMDAPPEREDCRPFLEVADRLQAAGVHAPEVYAQAPEQGFLLLEDLGQRSYLEALDETSVESLYGNALGALMSMQACIDPAGLPPYDRELLLEEMELFRHWLLEAHLSMALTGGEERMLDEAFALLAEVALEQPRVFVHRDYHSRNLMAEVSPEPGVLDFQDAVQGPVTYDLVSLLRDCYIRWPRERVEEWAWGYFWLAVQSGVMREEQEAQFMRWFDLMGVQRHLKAAGIFARLYHRDHKPGYLGDIPRTLGYVVEVGSGYPELQPLAEFVEEKVLSIL